MAAATLLESQALLGVELGEPPPPLQVARWSAGGPLDLKKDVGKAIYVLIFWDSGCSACQAAVPDLIILQNKFQSKGVLMACITADPTNAVQQFAPALTNQVNLAIAGDAEGATFNAYMTASGKRIVPYAFVIDRQGLLAWHGYPQAGLETALQQMVDGKFDIATAKKALNAEKIGNDYFSIVTGTATNANADPVQLGNRFLADASSDPWLLNNFAWKIAADPRIKNRDLDLASRAVKIALAARGGKDPAFLDTYAKVLFEAGKTNEAIATQKQAISVCADQSRRAAYERTLANYEQRVKN